MFCPYCGKENENDSLFCVDCGKQLSEPQPITPAPQTPIKKPKERSPLITKEVRNKWLIALILILLYTGISALFIILLNLENSIAIKTVFDDDVTKHITLNQLLKAFVSGNKVFNPTTVTLALGVGTYTLIYSVPVFSVIALIGTFSGKKVFGLYTVSSVVTVLSVAATLLIAPLSLILIPDFKQVISASAGIVFNDFDKITFIPIIVFSVLIIALLVAIGIVTGLFNKRRTKK